VESIVNPETKKSGRSKLTAAARILFATVALVIVVHSVQFQDYITRDNQTFQIAEARGNGQYVVTDKTGRTLEIQVGGEGYQYRTGAVNLVQSARIAPVVVSLAIFGIVPLLLTYRWWILLKVQGVELPFWTTMELTLAGHFLNFFLIGTTGGDLVKAYWIGRFSPKKAEGFVSVFVDRFVGVVVLILLAAVLIIFMWRDPQVTKISRAVGLLVVLAALAVIVLFSQRTRKLIRFDRWKGRLPISGIIDRVDHSLLTYRRTSVVLAKAAGATVVLQLLSSTATYFLGSAIHMQVGIWYYFLYVPLAFLIGSIPVSVFWGLGLLEGAYVGFFSGSGFATVTQAAMLAMAVRLLQLVWSLPGSLVLAVGIGKKTLPTNFENEHELIGQNHGS